MRPSLRILLWSFILPALIAGCTSASSRLPASGAAASRDIPAPLRALRDAGRREISGERARELVAFMDDHFRLPGNTGFEASLDQVLRRLRAAGYQQRDSATAGHALTYHIVSKPMRSLAWDPIDARVTVEGSAGPLLTYGDNRNMIAINSWSTPDTGVVAEVVEVASGAAAAFESRDVRGRIVMAPVSVGALYAEAVVKRGAIGVVGYRVPAYNQPASHPNSITFTSIPQDTVNRAWGIALNRRAYDTLHARLARGPVRLRVTVRTRLFPSTERTVVAEVHGRSAPAERFVISAHVQEPGANDNASGVGALTEMAGALARLHRDGTARPARTITMLFGNEIAQTRDYLAADSARTRGVRWGLSLDMVGQDTRRTGGTFLIEKMPDPSAVWTRGDERHSEWGGSPLPKSRIVNHYFNDFLLDRCLDEAADNDWVVRTNPFEGGSDHTPFLEAGKPGVLFWHFTDVFYHTDGDRLVNVSPTTLKHVSVCATSAALALTTADGAMARAIIGQVERAAVRRLNVELALSQQALAGGGSAETERDILSTWTAFYVGALQAARDIEVGGSTRATQDAIEMASARVGAAGVAALRALRPATSTGKS